MDAVNEVLDGVLMASRRHDLFGGDLRMLTSLMAVAVDRSTSDLLPKIDASTAGTLATNISSVS